MEDPNQKLLKPNKLKWVGIFLLCLALIGGGVFMIRDGQRAGWFVFLFFAAGALTGLVQLLPNSSFLLLTYEGFTVRSLFRTYSTRWSEVKGFVPAQISRSKLVAYDFAEGYSQKTTSRSIAKSMSGYEAALPDTYGMKAEELADLMNQWKQKCSNS